MAPVNEKPASTSDKSLWKKRWPKGQVKSAGKQASSDGTKKKEDANDLKTASSGDAPPQDNRETSSGKLKCAARGVEYQITSLIKLLVKQKADDSFKAIAVVGMVGIGKTTICQAIFNAEEVKSHFVPRIWVSMSRGHNEDGDPKTALVKRILVSLGVRKEQIEHIYDKDKLSGLLYAVHLELIGKRYLIVLDDARESDQCLEKLDLVSRFGEHLSFGFPKGYGGTVIVTSRSAEVAQAMVGKENLCRISTLPDAKVCWSIFKESTKGSEKKDDDAAEGLEEELLEAFKSKCGGLPLAAKLMGEI